MGFSYMKSTAFRMLAILIVIVLASFIIIESLIIIEARKKEINKVDYVIVLGARLYGDIPAPALKERLKAAKDYLLDNEEVDVIVTGGQGADEDIAEAEAMSKYLIDNAIGIERIIIEDKSTSTFENLKFSLDILGEKEDNQELEVLIVTNDYHLFRSKFLAKRLGMLPYGLPAKTPPSMIPWAYIREYFAVIKSALLDR